MHINHCFILSKAADCTHEFPNVKKIQYHQENRKSICINVFTALLAWLICVGLVHVATIIKAFYLLYFNKAVCLEFSASIHSQFRKTLSEWTGTKNLVGIGHIHGNEWVTFHCTLYPFVSKHPYTKVYGGPISRSGGLTCGLSMCFSPGVPLLPVTLYVWFLVIAVV